MPLFNALLYVLQVLYFLLCFVAYVQKQYPGADSRMIKQSMAEKLQDVGKFKRRQMKGNTVDENEPEDIF